MDTTWLNPPPLPDISEICTDVGACRSYLVEHKGRLITMEYRKVGISPSGWGHWNYTTQGCNPKSDGAWRPVNNPLIRKRLDRGIHPHREG